MTDRGADVRIAARAGEAFPLHLFTSVRRRPTGQAKTHEVDGGMWQGRCGCRWHGMRFEHRHSAEMETARHIGLCGLCQKLGRSAMPVCSCMNCQRVRDFRRAAEIAARTRSPLAPAGPTNNL